VNLLQLFKIISKISDLFAFWGQNHVKNSLFIANELFPLFVKQFYFNLG